MSETQNTVNKDKAGKYLTFLLKEEIYGVSINDVIEIVGIQKIIPVPDMPTFMKGIINLRGQVYPVIDMRLRFAMREKSYDEQTCIVVVQLEERSFGLIVDNVKEVAEVIEEQIVPADRVTDGNHGRFMDCMVQTGDEVTLIINMRKLLLEDEFETIQGLTDNAETPEESEARESFPELENAEIE